MDDFAHKDYTYNGYALPLYYDKTKLEDGLLENFKFRKDDVIVTSFPRSGNTWMLCLLRELYPDLNVFEHDQMKISPMVEYAVIDIGGLHGVRPQDGLTPLQKTMVSFLRDPDVTPSPRLIKSHLPYEMFPKQAFEAGAKVIYIDRNPKDAVVSSYNWYGKVNILRGKVTWEEHLNEFIGGRLAFTPWVDHVAGWRKHSEGESVFNITYENMVKHTKTTVRAITEFLGRPLTESRIENAILNTSIDKLRNDPESASKIDIDEEIMSNFVAAYFRKGEVGDWKNRFTEAENKMFEDTIVAKMREKGVECVYE